MGTRQPIRSSAGVCSTAPARLSCRCDPIDTSTPQGIFSPQVLGAVAQLERALISECPKAGISAAKANYSSNPELTLREIASQLERLHERTPRGGTKWSPSSVKNLLDRVKKTGLVEVDEE